MDMKLNSQLIVTLRKQKAWSQQQLSIVSGVSLRTIQRVENESNASVETIKSIASAFETDIDKILNQPVNTKTKSPRSVVLFTCIASLIFSVFLTSSTTAATGIEIQSQSIFQSEDKSETNFEGNVRVIIPDETPFNILTVENSKNYQLKLVSNGSSMLISDAQISSSDKDIIIVADRVKSTYRALKGG